MSVEKVKIFVEKKSFQHFIIALIIFNSITIGLETFESIVISTGDILHFLDRIILAIFVVEITLKLYAYNFSFFKDGWNVFDFSIVAIALLPTTGSLSILRALRIFRSLRLIKNLPRLRFLVESLLMSLPSIGWIFALLSLIFYVFSVVGVKIFGATHPEYFGTLWASMFSLFQIMTLEGWADIARDVIEDHPFAFLYFIFFILAASYSALNIFIAIIVNTMSETQNKIRDEESNKIENIIRGEKEELKEDLRRLKEQIELLEKKLFKNNY